MPAKYTHKPTEVEAIKVSDDTIVAIQEFVGEGNFESQDGGYILHNGEGIRAVVTGDYIIKGVLGVFYPCSAAVFEESYEVTE